MRAPPRFQAFVVTAPGLETLAAGELRAIGVGGARAQPGGVTFQATLPDLYAANLHLRTASRVVVRLGDFRAEAFHELERKARRLPWGAFVSPNLPVRLRVTCRKSRLYHSDAVAERVAGAIESSVPGARFVERVADAAPAGPADDSAEEHRGDAAEQLIIVRLFRDRCTVSIDSSGALLHLRGYRQAVAKAPMRETLAAAALIAAGWRGNAPLLDPLCGAGTIPIEGALIARRIAPGIGRRFAFMDWPDYDDVLWRRVADQAGARTLPRSPVPIAGSDRDAGAIAAAIANAERAGVAGDLELVHRAISDIAPPATPGWLVTNPPYGVRVGERDRLRNLYAQLGKVARAKCAGWTIALVSADRELVRQVALPLEPVLQTSNGGIPVTVVAGRVPARDAATPIDEPADSPHAPHAEEPR